MIRPGSRAVRKEREAANASAAKLPVYKTPSSMNYEEDYVEDDFDMSNNNDMNLNQHMAKQNVYN